MAEPLGVPARQFVAGGPDGLLATKLYVPAPPPGFVSRARLVDRLNDGLGRALILVCAPAGFGKTALLADWSQDSHRSVAWLSLDAGDNDPARFWRHVAAALDRVRPGIAKESGPLIGPPAPPSFDGLVAALVNELAARTAEHEVLLVLDDYHMIESRVVHASLTFLLEHLPPDLHLVVASRADPPLPLARLRGRGQLAELRAADLRFTADESAALLREAVGPELALPETAVEALTARTEGWAAGLQLAALSLHGRPDVAAFVETFSGSHRYILDYLTEEVLEREPEELRLFLLETSVLERLSGPLCDAVTGRTDGQATLEAIERANLFLVPLDDVRGWWRYHHLFGDLLRARLQQEEPGRVQDLHRRAASWHDGQGLTEDAVRHALAAGEAEWAARLVERDADALILRSEEATLRRWLTGLPPEVVGARPRLLLAQAMLAMLRGDLAAVEGPLDAAEREAAAVTDEPYEPSVGRANSVLANINATIALWRASLAEFRGDAERTKAFSHQALAEIGEGERTLEGITRLRLGIAEWLDGRLDEAERIFAFLTGALSGTDQPTVAAWASTELGRVQRAQGRLDAALSTYRRVLELTAGSRRRPLPAAGLGHVGIAEIAYQRDELDAALRHITEGIVLCRQIADAKPLGMGLATLAWIRQAQGDPGGARQAMEEASEVAPGPEVVDLLNPVPAQRARLLLAQEEVVAAVEWSEERGLGADDEPSYPREGEYLVLGRVLLARGAPDEALRVLERLHALAVAQHRRGSLIEINALRSLAFAAGGDEASAMAILTDALTLAHSDGWIRVFVDEGAPMGALLGRLAAARWRDRTAAGGFPFEYVRRLVEAVERNAVRAGLSAPVGRPSTAVIPGLVEALSERELEVLQLVAAGKSNQEIGDELYVTLDTVKKHLTHILGKLGATNRTEASARARELGLVQEPGRRKVST